MRINFYWRASTHSSSPLATLGSKFLFHSVFNTSPGSTMIRDRLSRLFRVTHFEIQICSIDVLQGDAANMCDATEA